VRYRVDLRFGYASFDESQEARARELYQAEGVRLRRCTDLFDEGEVIEGLPLEVEFTRRQESVN
jgi:hypothetical protein